MVVIEVMTFTDDWENNDYDDLTHVSVHLQNNLVVSWVFFYFFLKINRYAIPHNEIKQVSYPFKYYHQVGK